MAKATLKDIAAAAGVGVATVERVVNGRGGVKPDKVEKIVAAAKRLNYRYALSDQYRGIVRIEVILVRPETNFYSRTNAAFERISALLDNNIVVHRTFVKENDPVRFAEHISSPSLRRSALIVVAPSYPEIVRSVRQVASQGLPVIQMMAQPANELPYVGIDNYKAGRSAGFYMAGMLAGRSGSIIAHCHSGTYENHRMRISGFSNYLLEHDTGEHLFSRVSLDQDDEHDALELLAEALARDKRIIGLYTAGGDNVAIGNYLRKYNDRRILWIGHELTEHTARFLKEGIMSITIDQSPELQARRAVDLVLLKLGMIDVEVRADPVRFMTINRESI